MSRVGLTMGCGGEGACITSRMYCGGLLYPSPGLAEVEVRFEGADTCAALTMHVEQAARAAAKKQIDAFCSIIVFPNRESIL